jgi:hypothetical protein
MHRRDFYCNWLQRRSERYRLRRRTGSEPLGPTAPTRTLDVYSPRRPGLVPARALRRGFGRRIQSQIGIFPLLPTAPRATWRPKDAPPSVSNAGSRSTADYVHGRGSDQLPSLFAIAEQPLVDIRILDRND